jgi:hypothetical protein
MTNNNTAAVIDMTKNAAGTYRVAPKLHIKPCSASAMQALVSGQMSCDNLIILPLE